MSASGNADAHAVEAAAERAFWARKIFSFFGVVPLGLYVLWHLWNNLYALKGEAAFDGRLNEVTGSALYQPLIWLCVYIPLVVHAAVGLAITWRGRPNPLSQPHVRNFKYLLQRASAIGIVLFVPTHVFKTKVEPWMHHFSMNWQHMHEGMLEPLTFTVYALGMLGVCFHLANGLWLAGITWGVFTGPRAQRRAELLSIAFGLALLGMAFGAIYALRGH